MFVTNPCTHDARVMKEASTLSTAGYDVRVFALANAHNDPGIFEQDSYSVHRLKFDNIFVRIRESVWSFFGLVFAPFRWLKRLVSKFFSMLTTIISAILETCLNIIVNIASGMVFSVKAILALPFFLLSKLFPSYAGKVLERMYKRHLGLETTGYDVRSGGEEISLRRIKVYTYLELRKRLPFRIRRPTQKVVGFGLRVTIKSSRYISKFRRIIKNIFRIPKVSYYKVRRALILTRTFVRRFVARTRSKMIGKVNRGIYHIFLPFHKVSTYYYFCKAASTEAVEWNADVCHAHDLNTMYGAYLAEKKLGCKVVYDSHELWIHRNRVGRKATLEKLLDKIVERWLIKSADIVITVCDSIGDWLVARYPDIPKPVIVRNMPHLLTYGEDEPALVPLKSRLDIPETALTMVYTGKLTSGRGLEIGMQALSEIDNLYLVLLGYGEPGYVHSINALAKELDIEQRMIFCEAVPHDEVTRFIYGADFALVYIEPVCLSYEYALPNKLFESIQAGIPILGSDLVEIEKLVEERNIGLCFATPRDLADKIRLNTSARQLAEWRASIQQCQDELCWESEKMKLVNSYHSLLT